MLLTSFRIEQSTNINPHQLQFIGFVTEDESKGYSFGQKRYQEQTLLGERELIRAPLLVNNEKKL